MWARLKVTKDRWRQRAKSKTAQCRQLREQLRAQRAKNAALEAQVARLRLVTDPVKVFNCHYPAQIMALAIFIVLHGGSLRCAAATVGFYSQLMSWKYKTPAWRTIPNWVERCGLYALLETEKLSGDYRAIIDGSIQVGKEQLMLLLGVKADIGQSSCRNVPLKSSDVVVLGMEVQSSWTGQSIAEFITASLKARPKVNVLHFVNDRGSNILAALRSLDRPWVSDCTHVMMNAVKNIFGADESLSELCRQIGRLRQQLNLTDWAGLLPPTLRDKDRFLRIFTIIKWADRMDAYQAKLPTAIKTKIAFYLQDRWLLLRLRQVHELVCLTGYLLRRSGLSDYSEQLWKKQVKDYLATQSQVTRQAKRFISIMEGYFADHALQYMGSVDGLLCSSEIIESTFGRYKNKGGMRAISSDVLAIPLYNQKISLDFVVKAMGGVSGPQLDEWRCRHVCHNKYGQRKQLDRELKAAA
jgi:hypothetical protein